jgi:hypothetical protein
MTGYIYGVVFKSGTVNEVFVLDKGGKIAGIHLSRAQ